VGLSAALKGLFRGRRPVTQGRLIPAGRDDRTIFPPEQHVELRFTDGTTKVVDPRSPEASALQDLADQLRQSGS
jgi:hypothetical protein